MSLFLPLTHSLWQAVDTAFFKWINLSLKNRPLWQLFWACANHKLADWIEDVCILGFFIAYVKQALPAQRPRKLAELLFCTLYIGAVIYFINRLVFRENLIIPRESPTLVVPESILLSKEVSWMAVKDGSSTSFPGDHGTTALLFGAMFSYLSQSWRLTTLACLYTVFLCLPRLITGAHWLSDIVVGSGTITLITLSWAFYTPLFHRSCQALEKLFRWNKSVANSSANR
jgi:membrane-associated phospholipid phosphatase